MTKRVVRCEVCKRRYDVSKKKVGSAFRCKCGEVVTIPEDQGHDAAVVRCSGCGAAREDGSVACSYCGSDFTLRETDLNAVCPSCQTRVSSQGRFCHHCGSRTSADSGLGEATDLDCPVCGPERLLVPRRLPGLELNTLECQVCAGLWLDIAALHTLLEDESRRPAEFVPTHRKPEPPSGIVYRKCVRCQAMMIRRNFGRTSGVMLDICGAHGLWFDAEELSHLLNWMRAGGLKTAQQEAAKLIGSPDSIRRKFAANSDEVPPAVERRALAELAYDQRMRDLKDGHHRRDTDEEFGPMLFLAIAEIAMSLLDRR